MMELRDLLIDTFKNSTIPNDISDLKMGDFDELDSLGNFNLILAIEQHFHIQFDISDMENLISVREIQREIDSALSKK